MTNCISLRLQNATWETVLYPNAEATSLFPFTVTLFQMVNQIRFSRCLRHFSCSYYSFPFLALYHRPTAIVQLRTALKKKKKRKYNTELHLKGATKTISIKFYFNCLTLHVASYAFTRTFTHTSFSSKSYNLMNTFWHAFNLLSTLIYI